MSSSRAVDPLTILRRFAPGTQLRAAAELILRQGTGALILIAGSDQLEDVCSGGFLLRDARFTAQRLAELAKMDAGIVVSEDASTILRANVHFVPDAHIPTSETGTRFRTAERLAKQTGSPVLSISEEGRPVAVVFTGSDRYELRSPSALHAEGNQNLISLERLRRRLHVAEGTLTRLEVDDVVTVGDVALLLQRAALVARLGDEIARIVVELGGSGHLIAVQAADLLEGVDDLAVLVFSDYARQRRSGIKVFERLETITTEDLHDAQLVAEVLGLGEVDEAVRPRGVRALERVPRLPESVKDALITHFRSFPRLMNASVDDLATVEGVGSARAHQVRTYLDRLPPAGAPSQLPE